MKKKTSNIKLTEEDFPDELIEAYIEMRKQNFKECAHKLYLIEVKKYLKNKFGDPIEQCKLIVMLSRKIGSKCQREKNKPNQENQGTGSPSLHGSEALVHLRTKRKKKVKRNVGKK